MAWDSLTVELKMLLLGVVLGIAQIVVTAAFARRQYGLRWAASARDEPVPPHSKISGRLHRAFDNYMATFPFFAAAVLAAHAANVHNWASEWGALLYFWGRVAYVPLYGFGIPLVRSLAWNVATVGILLILAAFFIR